MEHLIFILWQISLFNLSLPMLSTLPMDKGCKLWKQGAQVRNAFPSATSESGSSQGQDSGSQELRKAGTTLTLTSTQRERTECAACAKKSCAPKGPNLPSSRKCSHLRSRILPYRTIAHGANALTCSNLYPRTSWNSKEAEFRQRSCALLHFSGRTYCSNNGSFKLKLPRH